MAFLPIPCFIIIDDELNKAGIKRPANAIGIGWAGPTILLEGTEEQKERYLRPILTGKNSGVKCSANPMPDLILLILLPERFVTGDEYIINGSKSGPVAVTIHNSEYLSLEQTRCTETQRHFLLHLSYGSPWINHDTNCRYDYRSFFQSGFLRQCSTAG